MALDVKDREIVRLQTMYSYMGMQQQVESDGSLTEKDEMNLRIDQLERDNQELEALVSKLKLQVVKLKRRDVKTYGDVGLTCNLLSEASETNLKNKIADLQRELDQEKLSS